MTQIKLAHIADCHLRTQQYGRQKRGEDFSRSLRSAIMKAHEEGADAILCAGDLLDTRNPGSKVCLAQLNDIQNLLQSLQIPMLVISGNHDNCCPAWHARFPLHNTWVRTRQGYDIPVGHSAAGGIVDADDNIINLCLAATSEDTQELPPLTCYGSPYETAAVFRERLPLLPDTDILMWHGEIKEFCGYPKENTIEIGDFPVNNWQLVAMGDQHVHRMITRKGGNAKNAECKQVIAYPGSTELCDASEDENKQFFMHTFVLNNERWELTTSESIAFETTPVQRINIDTKEDLEQSIHLIKPGALVFVKYNKEVPNVATEIKNTLTVLDPDGTTVLRLMPKEAITEANTEYNAASGKFLAPHEFVVEEGESIFPKDKRTLLEPICAALLNPALDGRAQIDKFCKEQLDCITL